MQITRVDLENVKSYHQHSVAFTEGTNAICGPNGAGKSTLVEAIGFALFGYSPFASHDQFVREGEKVATITVHLVDDDERTYQVVRKCGSYSQHYVYDPELEQKLVEGVGDTTDWLRDLFGVEENSDLAALFQDAVGVPQGLLTAAFLDRPGNRKNTFNPLLRVDEYEKAWQALLEPRRCLEGWIADQENAIAGHEAEVKALPGWREKATGLEAGIVTDQERLAKVEAELKEMAGRKEELEKVRERLEALRQQAAQAEEEVKGIQGRLDDARAALNQAEAAQQVVQETEEAHTAYVEAQSGLNKLETERNARDRLKETLHGHQTDLALARQRVERVQRSLDDVATAEAEMATLEPLVEDQEQLEAAVAGAERAVQQLKDKQKELTREKKRLEKLEAQQADLQGALAERTATLDAIQMLRDQSIALVEQREGLVARISGMETERERLAEQSASLKAVETAQCPLCERPLTLEHRTELLDRNRAEIERLEEALAEERFALEEMGKDQSANKKALRELEKRLADLPRPAEAGDLAERIVAQQGVVTEAEAAVAGLTGAPQEVVRLKESLVELGDPRRDYQRAADTADRRPALEKELSAAEEQIAELVEQIAAVDQGLAAYVDLDKQIEAQRAALATHKPGYQRYLEHVREAESLPERQRKAAALESGLEVARREWSRLAAERDKGAAEYDAEAYAHVTASYDNLHKEAATLDERLRQQRKQLAEAQAEVAQLEEVQEELVAACAERDELQEVQALLEYLRHVLRDAGPKITQALVEVISLQAARMYTDIMADHSARLRWTDDYEILLAASGRERAFRQLSGGEQMAAALSVRLALLREVSDIDVAFFDEPTANLDEVRRDNLAEQITNVKGFSQLFVISHDDTFERDTDNVVRVIKENSVSRVEE